MSITQSTKKRFSKATRPDLLNGEITPTLWAFALPLIFSFMVQMIYSLTDTYFVSRLGASAIGALGFCDQINFIVFTVGSGFAVGTGVIVARRIGEGNMRDAAIVARQAIASMIILASLVSALLYITIDPIFVLLGVEGEVKKFALEYMYALLWAVTGNLVMFQINSIIRSVGNTTLPMKILLTTTFINALCSPLLIFGIGPFPELGMIGAGLGTGIAQFIGAITGITFLVRGSAGMKLELAIPTFDPAIIKSIIRLGIPSSLQMLAISSTRIVFFALANTFGTSVIAAYTIGLRLDFFIFMPIFAFGVTMEVVTGQHLGAKKVERIMKYYNAILLQLGSIVAIFSVLVFFFHEYFARLFTDDITVITNIGNYLRIHAFAYVFFVVMVISIRLLSGAGAVMQSLAIVAFSGFCIQVPLAYFLSQHTTLNETGIWLAIVAGHLISAAAANLYIRQRKWIAIQV
jgi:putative MATE family efflux protein